MRTETGARAWCGGGEPGSDAWCAGLSVPGVDAEERVYEARFWGQEAAFSGRGGGPSASVEGRAGDERPGAGLRVRL